MTAYDVLTRNLEEVQERLQDCGSLLDRLKENGDSLVLRRCVSCSQETQRLKEALLEAIQTLDESRKAFKSKQLEMLRKKLMTVLAESTLA